MTSIVEICNQALGHIAARSKVETVFPAPESTVEARNCNIYFHTARKATLEAFDWDFASREGTLSLYAGDATPDRWGFQYAWPADCVAPREIVRALRTTDEIPFKTSLSSDESTKLIWTDEEDASLRYTRDLENVERWPATATTALGWMLGFYLAVPVSRSLALQKECMEAFNYSLGQATAYTARTQREDAPRMSSWHRAR